MSDDYDDRPDDFHDPHHDIDAERYVLAAMMHNPQAIEAAAEQLIETYFYRPAHQVLFHAMVSMFAAGDRVDPMTLRLSLQDNDEMRTLGPKGALYLIDLMELPADPVSMHHYARVVFEHAVRREMAAMAGYLAGKAADPAADVLALVDGAETQLAQVRATLTAGERAAPLMTVDDFLEQEVPHGRPVIPGLLDHQDRVVVVGAEGAGKTTLAHQVAFCAASGVHPFDGVPIRPQRVMIMDFENPIGLLQRRFRRLKATAETLPAWEPDNLIMYHRPGGANLTSPHEAFQLAQLVKQAEPDLIIAGPIYKMLVGLDEVTLASHSKLTNFFDRLREAHGCAVWLEAHAPFGGGPDGRTMRPEGSNIWSKWPEFGLALNKATAALHGSNDGGLDLGGFRGGREEGRGWPSFFTRNRTGNGWPWHANWDHTTNHAPMEPPPPPEPPESDGPPGLLFDGQGDA